MPAAALRAAVTARGSLDPKSLFAGTQTGCWYDPSDLGSMFQDSAGTTACAVDSPVGRINDKSGNGNHAVQATAGSRPVLRQASGQFYLEFDGVDDSLQALFTFAQPIDRVSAIRPDEAVANSSRFFAGGNDEGGQFLWATGNVIYISSNTLLQIDGAPALASLTSYVFTERHSGTSSRAAVNSGGYTTGDANTNAAGGMTIGDYRVPFAPAKFRFYGALAIGRKLSDAEIASLRAWMGKKIGLRL